MMFHLKHERHGYKIAYDWTECESDKRHGWKEYDPRERDQLIAEKIKTQSSFGGSTSFDAGPVGEASQTTAETVVTPVETKRRGRPLKVIDANRE